MLVALLVVASALGHLPGQHANGPPESHVALIQALVDEDLSRFRELLDADRSQVNAVDVITPLYAAQEYVRSSRQRHDVLRKLLKAGALPDQPTQDGSTTLMLAAYHGVRACHLATALARCAARTEHAASARACAGRSQRVDPARPRRRPAAQQQPGAQCDLRSAAGRP